MPDFRRRSRLFFPGMQSPQLHHIAILGTAFTNRSSDQPRMLSAPAPLALILQTVAVGALRGNPYSPTLGFPTPSDGRTARLAGHNELWTGRYNATSSTCSAPVRVSTPGTSMAHCVTDLAVARATQFGFVIVRCEAGRYREIPTSRQSTERARLLLGAMTSCDFKACDSNGGAIKLCAPSTSSAVHIRCRRFG
jgi:hypothetical protein